MAHCIHLPHLTSPKYRPDHWENPKEERIEPYEGSAVPNYPGGSNIFHIPFDLYYTGKALAESFKHGDHEEILDASTRLFGIPANLISTGGTIASYGKAVGVVAHLPLYLTPVTIIAGLVLCVVEGLVDVLSLLRQKRFESKFDFELLSHLRNIIVDREPNKIMHAIKEITTMVNKDPSSFKSLIGDEQVEIIQKLLNEIHDNAEKKPELLPTIMSDYRPALEEVATQLLVENFEKIKDDYLLITEDKKKEIEEAVQQKNPGLGEKELLELQKKELEITSTIKKKQLARRVRPWMVEEATKTINPLLQGIVEGESEAIHEGLKFIDDMHIQSKKKALSRVLGVTALVIAAASLIALAVTCPTPIPYILAGVAMTLALARAGIFSGTLESRGWTFEPKKLLPLSIRKRIFSNPGPKVPEIKHLYQRVLISEEQRQWPEPLHKKELNLEKQRFEYLKQGQGIELLHKRELDLEKQRFESFSETKFINPPQPERLLFV